MRGVALCCGFNAYEKHPLTTAVNDATTIHSTLMRNRLYNSDRALMRLSKPITHDHATGAEILDSLEKAASGTADLVWFSFSGHGVVTNGELHLLLPKWMESREEKYAVRASALEGILRGNRGKKFVLVLDACNTGAFGMKTRDFEVAPPRAEEAIASSGGVVFSACAHDQLASDGDPAAGAINGLFTHCLLEVLQSHQQSDAALGVLKLFFASARATRATRRSAQVPMLYANGLTDDFQVLEGQEDATEAKPSADGLVRLSLEVPAKLCNELHLFVNNAVAIKRAGYIGLLAAERQLERLAGELYKYRAPRYIVEDFSANVREAYSNARKSIIASTTPSYFQDWRDGGGGQSLLYANEEFIRVRNGRVIRFFFVQGPDITNRYPELTNILREHLSKGVHAVVVDVSGYGANVLKEVWAGQPVNLDSLEFAFVDGAVFLKTIFAMSGISIEVDQGHTTCRLQYVQWLKPFLTSRPRRIFRPRPDRNDPDDLSWGLPLNDSDVETLRTEIEASILDRA
jgi:hypothetical protein